MAVYKDSPTQLVQAKHPGSARALKDVSNRQGGKKSLRDERSGVKAVVQHYPSEDLIPKELRQKGVVPDSLLYGTEGDCEKLWPEYQVRRKPRNFFVVGRVFSALWPEPAGNSVVSRKTVFDRLGQPIFSKIRRFVVIREGKNFCTGLAISTYGRRGVSAPAVDKSEHVIIYTGKNCSNVKRDELPKRLGEGSMRAPAIQVNSDNPMEKLDEMSRLNLASVHTIQHNIKVRNVGLVSEKSLPHLLSHFDNVWKMKNSSSKKGKKPVKVQDVSADGASESDSQDEDEASDGEGSDEEDVDRGNSKGKGRAKDDDDADDDEDEEESDEGEEEDESEDESEDDEEGEEDAEGDDDDDEGSDDSDA